MMRDQSMPSADIAIAEPMAEAIAAYALDALTPEEEATVVAYLGAHPAARRLLAEYRAIIGMLAYAAAPSVPPATLRLAVLHAIHTDRPRTRAVRGPARTWLTAAFALVLALTVLLWNLGPLARPDRTTIVASTATSFFSTPGIEGYDLLPDGAVQGATGRIYQTPDGTHAALVVTALPALAPDQTYQLWFDTADQGAVSIGTFTVDARGGAVVVVSVPPARVKYVSCRITRELRGGSRSPTGPRILVSGVWDERDADDASLAYDVGIVG